MKYAFRFTTHAQRQLRSMGRQDALHILTGITPLGSAPWREDLDVKKLAGHPGLLCVRVGNFRLVYEVQDDILVILVLHVGNRRDVHRDL